MAAGEWDPPAIIGFCEIENRRVLEDLIYGTNLARLTMAFCMRILLIQGGLMFALFTERTL